MKKHTIWVIGAVALSLALASFKLPSRIEDFKTAKAQATWDKIGQGSVQANDKGMGTVNALPGRPVQSLKIKVLSGGVNIHRCEIWFSDGTRKEVEMRNDVPAGSESREINVSDTLRQISKLVFWYDTRNYNKRSDLELWGKKLS